jgi:hypothetical protein
MKDTYNPLASMQVTTFPSNITDNLARHRVLESKHLTLRTGKATTAPT